MLSFSRFLMASFFIVTTGAAVGQGIPTGAFHRVIVSPFIEATFIQGDQEQVVINHSSVDPDKLHIDTKNGTLRVYLEGAKEIPRNDRDSRGRDNPPYPDHAVTATIYYKKLDALSLRGAEAFSFPGSLSAQHFTLKLYGESAITFAKMTMNELHTAIYGESAVEIQSGTVNRQYYTCYGEGRVNTTAVSGEEARLTAYGDADFRINISGQIRITSFGEAKLRYKGSAQVVKRINVGAVDIARLD